MKFKELVFTPITIFIAFSVSSMLFFGSYMQPMTTFFKTSLNIHDDKTLCFHIMALGNFMTIVSVFIMARAARILEIEKLQRRIRKSALNLVPLMFLTFSNVLCAYIFKVGEDVMLRVVMCLAATHLLYFYFSIISSSLLTLYVESLIFCFNILLLSATFYEDMGRMTFSRNMFSRFFEKLVNE
ncbi:putative transporter [Trachipleistophora hominis]|uniref:Putative transporter n=1 Tax=Trachipleistophora hominis TaxID=72359 RepID=L7JQS1_TRAHO|nr:putative transporter [Trachipleistophora hominis]